MKKIINPISTSIIEKEINKDTFVRKTNYCNHDIYIVDYHNHPNTTIEIGRLSPILGNSTLNSKSISPKYEIFL
jgi:hypothetical protein